MEGAICFVIDMEMPCSVDLPGLSSFSFPIFGGRCHAWTCRKKRGREHPEILPSLALLHQFRWKIKREWSPRGARRVTDEDRTALIARNRYPRGPERTLEERPSGEAKSRREIFHAAPVHVRPVERWCARFLHSQGGRSAGLLRAGYPLYQANRNTNDQDHPHRLAW